MIENITQEELKTLFSYDPKTGIFTNKVHRGNRSKIGCEIKTKDRKGYIRAGINGTYYFFHRLAWLYVYGVPPKEQIDHINGKKDDNRIENLREATNSQNKFNSVVRKDSGSGLKGVHLDKRTNRWRAKITVNKKTINLGFFATKDEAWTARKNANHMHGEFAKEK